MRYDLSIVQLRETAAQFRASLPVPSALQLCVETDTGRAFAGDGTTVITALQDLKLSGEERTHADLVWDQMRLSDERDDTGDGGTPSTTTPPGLYMAYSDDTISGDPGAGAFRFNSTSVGSITKMYVNDIDQDGTSNVAWLGLVTSGVLKLNKGTGGQVMFSVSRMQDKSGYFEFDVEHVFGTLPAVGNHYVDFVPDAPGVREFNFLLTAGVGTATIEVLRDTMTETPDVNYISTGVIRVELTGAFPTHKVETSFSALTKIIDAGDTPSNIQCTQDPNYIGIITYDDSFTPQDLSANDLLITIKVYP